MDENETREGDPYLTPCLDEKSSDSQLRDRPRGIPEGDPKVCPCCGQRLRRKRRASAPEGTKYCSGPCKELRPLDHFHADASKKEGRGSTCIDCKQARNEAARDKTKPERRRYRTKKRAPRRNAEDWLIDKDGFILPPDQQ